MKNELPDLFKTKTYLPDDKPSLIREATTDLTFRNADTRYLTHNFHSYPAKFIPQLATWLILEYSRPGTTVFDPFTGSGTTLVEAMLNDRNGVGTEINPIGRLTTLAKSTPIDVPAAPKQLDELYRGVLSSLNKYQKKHFFGFSVTDSLQQEFDLWVPSFENFGKWFLPEVIVELAVIRHEIMKLDDEKCKVLALVAFSSIIKSVSNARTDERNPKLRKETRKKPDTVKLFHSKLDKMTKDIIAFSEQVKGRDVSARVVGNDARTVPLPDNAVDLIVTSPPYAYAMDYVRMHKLSLYWLGEKDLIELDKQFIGTEKVYAGEYSADFSYPLPYTNGIISDVVEKSKKKGYILFKYFSDMHSSIREMHRVLRKDGTATIVIGNSTVQQVDIPTHECFNKIALDVGFKVLKPLIRSVPRESKGLSHVHAELGGEMVDKEYINIFKKSASRKKEMKVIYN